MNHRHIIIVVLMALAFVSCAKRQEPPPPGLTPDQLLRHNLCVVNPTAPECIR